MKIKKLFHSKSADRKVLGIWSRIDSLLQEHNMTVYRFSNYVGIPETTIHNWRCGTCFPSAKHLIIIADYFGVSVDFLCGRG